jgi:hypothetical protein
MIFQSQPIDTTRGTKIQGALEGPLLDADDGSSESETDSDEDFKEDDTHKLRQLAHTARLKRPITARIREQFQEEGDTKHDVFL